MDLTGKTYHQMTSYERHAIPPHQLDWENKPAQFKTYLNADHFTLPTSDGRINADLLDIYHHGDEIRISAETLVPSIGRAISLACALTAEIPQPGRVHYLRSSPSAGALYPNEVYLAQIVDAKALPAGIYHYGMDSAKLTPLRFGDTAGAIADAFGAGGMNGVCTVLMVTGIFFRSAWKYRKRAYRYVLLDAGHLIENLVLALRANGQVLNAGYNFDDAAANRLLGIDPEKEVCLAGIYVTGENGGEVGNSRHAKATATAMPSARTLAHREIRYDAISGIHRSGYDIVDPESKPLEMHTRVGITVSDWRELKAPVDDSAEAVFDFEQSLLRRRSRRNFVPDPIGKAQFAYLLEGIIASFSLGMEAGTGGAAAVCCGILAGRIDGLPAGFYVLDPLKRRLGAVHQNNGISEMASICLDQSWLKNAGVHFVFTTNLSLLDKQWGPRGYRYAMMTAGRMGHAVYLGATALGLGCCGIGAFYDDEARRLLGLNPDSAMLYLVAAGRVKSFR